jgi:hypothetical protein
MNAFAAGSPVYNMQFQGAGSLPKLALVALGLSLLCGIAIILVHKFRFALLAAIIGTILALTPAFDSAAPAARYVIMALAFGPILAGAYIRRRIRKRRKKRQKKEQGNWAILPRRQEPPKRRSRRSAAPSPGRRGRQGRRGGRRRSRYA